MPSVLDIESTAAKTCSDLPPLQPDGVSGLAGRRRAYTDLDREIPASEGVPVDIQRTAATPVKHAQEGMWKKPE